MGPLLARALRRGGCQLGAGMGALLVWALTCLELTAPAWVVRLVGRGGPVVGSGPATGWLPAFLIVFGPSLFLNNVCNAGACRVVCGMPFC